MKKKFKQLLCGVLVASVVMTGAPVSSPLNMGTAIVAEAATAKPKLSKSKATVYVGDKVTIKLNNVKSGVKWKTSKKSVATIKANGTSVTITGKKAGKATITATYKKKKYKCTVTVKAKPVSLSSKKKTIEVGSSFNLSLKNAGSGAKWSTSNKKVAKIKKVSATKYTITGKKKGTAKITVKYKKKKYTCTVTVKNPTPKLSVTSKTVEKGTPFDIKLTNGNSKTVWSVSNNKVLKLTKLGTNSYRVSTIGVGTAYVYAKYGNTTYKCTVTVTAVAETEKQTETQKQTETEKQTETQKQTETEKVDTTPETEKQTESETPSETLPDDTDDSATMDPTESSGGSTETEKATESTGTSGSENSKDTEKETTSTESETQKQTETETEKQTETESETPSETETESETKQTETETEASTDDYSAVRDKTLAGGATTKFNIYTDKDASCFTAMVTGNSAVVTKISSGSINGKSYVGIQMAARTTGTSTVYIKCNDEVKASCVVTVTSDDSSYYNYTSWKENVKSQIWTDGMNDVAKLTAIGQYICDNYDYNASNWDYYCFSNGYGGDCYAASHLICDFANDLGLESRVDHVYGVATHVCAVVNINGSAFVVDAGIDNTAGNRDVAVGWLSS